MKRMFSSSSSIRPVTSGDGHEMHAFRRDLDKFVRENPHLDVKNWEIVQYDTVSVGNSSYNVAAKIVVFLKPKW